ncbi:MULTISPECIES: transcriptional regulator [Streptomyces]|uniref:Helix-turn-helix domain-containing protein n=1 Tax=Streptomyces lycii TaxID=2654337 RepID=A0ABQ7FGH6_9ACTN|nr:MULTISPECIES: transcriptional regulator [Streptomyces]KAF4407658.1 helix-turn-helix domain-containing protein [Streptomyces lycii]PGH48549.1 MarR family transcriptional regulator [Streptomyces sp. Ru87]
MSGPEPVFDEVVHAPYRLRICVLLAATDTAEFSLLREELQVSDSVLSKHLKVLREAKYLTMGKEPAERAPRRTYVSLTTRGRKALDGHLAELRRLAALAAPED